MLRSHEFQCQDRRFASLKYASPQGVPVIHPRTYYYYCYYNYYTVPRAVDSRVPPVLRWSAREPRPRGSWPRTYDRYWRYSSAYIVYNTRDRRRGEKKRAARPVTWRHEEGGTRRVPRRIRGWGSGYRDDATGGASTFARVCARARPPAPPRMRACSRARSPGLRHACTLAFNELFFIYFTLLSISTNELSLLLRCLG